MSSVWLSMESAEVRVLRRRVRELEAQLQAETQRRPLDCDSFGDVVVVDWGEGEGSPVRSISANIRRLGYEPEAFIHKGLKFADIIHPEDARPPNEPPHWVKADESGQVLSDRSLYRILRPDGQQRWVLDCSLASCDENGRIRNARGFLVDVTEQRAADWAATHGGNSAGPSLARPEQQSLLTEIYDRLRGPTAAIDGHAGLLLSGEVEPKVQQEYLRAIRRNCELLRRVSSQVEEHPTSSRE